MRRLSPLPLLCCLALGACASVSEDDVTMANALCQQGKLLLETHEAAQARDIFASAAMRDPGSARAWNGIGVSSDMLNRPAEAETAYQKALDIEPGNLLALNNLAHAYIGDGRYDDAVNLLEPHLNDAGVSETFRRTYAEAKNRAAQKAAQPPTGCADLGSFATRPLAEARLRAAKQALGDDAGGLSFGVDVVMKKNGGVPSFDAKIAGIAAPQTAAALCKELQDAAVACAAHDVAAGND